MRSRCGGISAGSRLGVGTVCGLVAGSKDNVTCLILAGCTGRCVGSGRDCGRIISLLGRRMDRSLLGLIVGVMA